ncbi:hypothetical protein BB560_004854 [Smittium megazygosporum]|uniref:Acyl-CoA thioesterase II domain-containing protein n=1 Tax=Smittium megazygosporum TaxID=133381 RepID=A0A2T9Z874_9FUNG|nr:hypothetical protein BB560_004854 [Smittium megazygosporum]
MRLAQKLSAKSYIPYLTPYSPRYHQVFISSNHNSLPDIDPTLAQITTSSLVFYLFFWIGSISSGLPFYSKDCLGLKSYPRTSTSVGSLKNIIPRFFSLASKPIPGPKMYVDKTIDVVPYEENCFRSKELWKPAISRGAFGGQIAAQALYAATKTVDPKFAVSSFHSYFLLPGSLDLPIDYKVQIVRNGKSYLMRSVNAYQNDKLIYIMMCSFAIIRNEPDKIQHQYAMPKVLPPTMYKSDLIFDRVWSVFDYQNPNNPNSPNSPQNTQSSQQTDNLGALWTKSSALTAPGFVGVDGRSIDPSNLTTYNPEQHKNKEIHGSKDPYKLWWMKPSTSPKFDPKANPIFDSQSWIAYLTDFRILIPALMPYDIRYGNKENRLIMMASLDHSVWFHTPFDLDDWFLYQMESPRVCNDRAYCTGRVYNSHGVMIASIAQEGMARVDVPKSSSYSVNYTPPHLLDQQ